MDLLWVESKGISHDLANVQSDLIVEIEPQGVLIDEWCLIVVYGCKCIQGACHLENFAQLILKELVPTAIMVEAEAGQVEKQVLNCALGVHVVIDVVSETKNVDGPGELEALCDILNVVHLLDSLFAEA